MNAVDAPVSSRPPGPDPVSWVEAFDIVTGRSRGVVPESVLAFVRRTLHAGARVAVAPSCPTAWVMRAAVLADVPRSRAAAPSSPASASPSSARVSAVAAVWKLVFDSWRNAVPAMRGAARTRFLRFAGPGGQLDLELVDAPDASAADLRLRGTIDGVEGPLQLEIAPKTGRAVRVAVGAGGAFSATLPGDRGPFALALRRGRRVLSRIGRVPPRKGA